MAKRKTTFLWKHKTGRLKNKLTSKAKQHLSVKLTEFHIERRKLIKRIRQQVVFNAESNGVNLGISIRIIAINGDFELKDMENALDEFLMDNEELSRMPFFASRGFEEEEIGEDEDKSLIDGVLYIELNIRGSQTLVRL